jgi:glycerol kinase
MKKFIPAFDQGTTGSRAILFDRKGFPVGNDAV